MPAPKEPILLWGFCFTTQQNQRFNNQWACAWLTSWFTDEQYLLSVGDQDKQREIRYGNNIAVLFRALLHLKSFYGQDGFWVAVGRGFNTSQTVARTTAEILIEARRAQRGKPAKEVSETARAADDWIDFLDSQPAHPRMLSDPELFKAAAAFFISQEKKWVNAARVPVSPRNSLQVYRPSPGPSGASPSARLPQTPMKRESPADLIDRSHPAWDSRKRSPSPDSMAPGPKSRRLNHDIKEQIRAVSDPQRQQDQAMYSDSRHISTTAQPAPPAPQGKAAKGEDVPSTSLQGGDDISTLKARIAELEEKLAASQNQGNAAKTQPATQAGADIEGLKKDMESATDAIRTMMETMHDNVDRLTMVQEEVSTLSKQQRELATALPHSSKLDAVLGAIQPLADKIERLTEGVSELKKQAAGQQPASGPPTAPCDSEITNLLREQNARIDRLVRDVASMQAHVSSSSPASLPRQAPQNLRQALAAAEREIKHHADVVQGFYYKLDGSHGVSRAVTERVADLLATLQHGVRMAQMGQQAS